MRLFIEANDVFMFRDGRPFSGGDDHFARTIFPPAPSTVYGALRSRILSEKWEEYDKFKAGTSVELLREIGSPETYGALSLNGFGLAMKEGDRSVVPYFPMPKDLVKIKGESEDELLMLKPEEALRNLGKTSLHPSLHPLWVRTENALEEAAGFIGLEGIEKYLLGESPESIVKPEEFFLEEERTGIRRDFRTRSVHEGGLYSVEYIRLNHNAGFFAEVEGTSLLPPKGLLRLGGDHRAGSYSEVNWALPKSAPIKKRISERRRFRLVFTTAGIFRKGWLPSGIEENSLEGSLNGVDVRLMAASVGRPAGVGGFDLVKGRPKPILKAVPAGSVYFFEMVDSDVSMLFEKLWWRSVSDERGQEGFGVCLLGAW